MLDKIHKYEFMPNIFMEKYGIEDVCLVDQSAIGFKIIPYFCCILAYVHSIFRYFYVYKPTTNSLENFLLDVAHA